MKQELYVVREDSTIEPMNVEETLEDIRAEANYERSELLTVADAIDMIAKLTAVTKEINDRTSRPNKWFDGDISHVRVNSPIDEIKILRTELGIAIQFGHDLKAELKESVKSGCIGFQLYRCANCGAERAFKMYEGLHKCKCGETKWKFVERFGIDEILSDDKRLRDTNIERYYTITQQREHIDVLEANLKASEERNSNQAYVIRNRINSFAEGVFSKALEEDIEVLKEELAVRTADSNMLGEIVDVVKMWDTDTCRANCYALLYIYNMLEDRIRNTVQEDL